MAILQAILTMLSQQVGRALNTMFGWATTLLFGEVPQKRQIFLSVIALGSVIWLAVTIGIAFPSVGTFLLGFVPLPDWVSDFWIRMIMLVLAVLVPAVNGVVSLFLLDPSERPRGVAEKLKAIVKGYPYTFGLALTLILMTIAAPIVKARDIGKRWTSSHVPIIVKAEDYSEVLRDVQAVLRKGGMETTPAPASRLLRWPTKIFTFFAGAATDLIADQLTVLQSPKIEVLLHPSDLVIHGREEDVMRAHALLTEHLTFTKAYLTWSKEAHQVEDRLGSLWREINSEAGHLENGDAQARLAALGRDLKSIKLSYEEWEVLFREKLLLERNILRMQTQAREEEAIKR